MMAKWFLETSHREGEWQRLKTEYPSASAASQAAGKALLIQSGRRLHKGFSVRLHREDQAVLPPPPPRPTTVTFPNPKGGFMKVEV